MKEEYEFILAILTKEDKVETIWNLLNMISKNMEQMWLENTLMYPKEFPSFLMSNNKISNLLYKVIICSDDYIKNHSLESILYILFDSLEKICKKNNKCTDYCFLNYLMSEYIFKNEKEKKYFYSEFIPKAIDKIHENEDSDFFENIKPNNISIEEVKDIKLYYFVTQHRSEKKYEIDLQIKKQEMFDKKIKSNKESLINDIDYLIETESYLDSLKSSLIKIKTQIENFTFDDECLL